MVNLSDWAGGSICVTPLLSGNKHTHRRGPGVWPYLRLAVRFGPGAKLCRPGLRPRVPRRRSGASPSLSPFNVHTSPSTQKAPTKRSSRARLKGTHRSCTRGAQVQEPPPGRRLSTFSGFEKESRLAK